MLENRSFMPGSGWEISEHVSWIDAIEML